MKRFNQCMAFLLSLLLLFGTAAGASAQGTTTDQVMFHNYEELYFRALFMLNGPDDQAHLDAMPKEARALFITAIFNMEIMNGGLCQFYVNEGSVYALYVPDSLRVLGMDKAAELYEQFIAENQITDEVLQEIDETNYSDDPKFSRYLELLSRYPFDAFDNEYTRLWYEEDEQKMIDFANAHTELFE